MADLAALYQAADWKAEKHVPVIEAPAAVTAGEFFAITASVGKEIAHPNTTAHHIRWIAVYFKPEGEKFPYEIGKAEFNAHGASAAGPDSSGVYTHPVVVLNFKTDKAGEIFAASYCNIHGLWQNSQVVKVKS